MLHYTPGPLNRRVIAHAQHWDTDVALTTLSMVVLLMLVAWRG